MADLIIVVTKGKVLEHGSHSELMRLGGLYAELYELQARALNRRKSAAMRAWRLSTADLNPSRCVLCPHRSGALPLQVRRLRRRDDLKRQEITEHGHGPRPCRMGAAAFVWN